jgi:hypothetical protein
MSHGVLGSREWESKEKDKHPGKFRRRNGGRRHHSL